ncbi:hypothetical protein HF086_012205 [Spodoptera exigua]|uniref:WD repeat-containing protein 66 n=1 Tax=Spodoptera exigua TaxID=7107 RepID=A0A922MDX7_SPOEX|nr:hypothetical protein HF086_012205 [Spodoptera exigua]
MPRLSSSVPRLPNSMAKMSFSDNDAGDMFKQYHSLSQHFFDKFQGQTGSTPIIQKPAPFKMRWINGFNHRVGVINLNDKGSTILFYSASNCGVIYNWSTHHMWLLQGHRHMITCIAADDNGRWLVTADSGSENVLIIWDVKDLFPQKTFFSPHGSAKIAKVALSGDAKYLLSLAYSAEKTSLYFWIWSHGQDFPHAIYETTTIPRDSIIVMGFNPSKSEQFLMMTRTNILIGVSKKVVVVERGISRETNRWEIIVKSMDAVNPEYGKLMCYTFVKGTSQILLGTTRGAVLVYGYTIEYKANLEPMNIDNLRYIKMLKLNKKLIHVIKNIDGLVVLLLLVPYIISDLKNKLNHCNKICPCWEKVEVDKDPDTGEDAFRTVCVYKYNCETFKWVFIGKHRSHYRDITALVFVPSNTNGGEYKLLSFGLDRSMVEYDIANSKQEYLEIASLDRFKYKIVNYATTMTLSTVLGPRYDHPVSKMQLVTHKKGEETKKYLLFSCREVIGLQKLPLDGNPWKHVGLLGHPIKILCQGTFSPARRQVKDYIPIDSLPDLMRALGFFPSEYEKINFSDFLTEIIGIQEMENVSDSYSGMESMVSIHTITSYESND